MVAVAFLGSHGLGADCLSVLRDHPEVDVDVVVTYPPDHDGWWEGSVREVARELDCEVLPIAEERCLREFDVDYLLSVYYPNILDEELLAVPSELPLNLHQAELPRYRGSNVFSHAIMNARADDHWRYGTTLHVMAPDVDAGDIVDRRFVDITEMDTARTLYERTCEASLELFESTLPAIVDGSVAELATPQDAYDGERYFYAKDSLDGQKRVDADAVAADDPAVYDRIRALDFPPFEPAYTELQGQRLYLTLSDYERLGGTETGGEADLPDGSGSGGSGSR